MAIQLTEEKTVPLKSLQTHTGYCEYLQYYAMWRKKEMLFFSYDSFFLYTWNYLFLLLKKKGRFKTEKLMSQPVKQLYFYVITSCGLNATLF